MTLPPLLKKLVYAALGSLWYNPAVQNMFFRRQRRFWLVTSACLGVLAGLGGAYFFSVSGLLLIPLVTLVLLTLRSHSAATALLLCALCFCLGNIRGSQVAVSLETQARLHMRKVTVVGQATDEAIYAKNSQTEVVLSNVQVQQPFTHKVVGNMTVRGFGSGMIYRGDTVQATGKWYPTRGNSVGSISFGKVDVLAHDMSGANSVRRQFAAGMQSALPEPSASFALGLLIGQRTTLPDVTETQLRMVGLTHIIAVSGYNLTVIVLVCRRWFARFSKFQATIACIVLIFLFLLMTGTPPPIVRASIISLLGIAAWYYGRQFKPLVLLLLGAAITGIANPSMVWGNVSWYLSFLAFYGVLVLAPLLSKRIMGQREPKMLASLCIESLCATVAVVPYVLYIFGQTSLVSLLANLLVVPFIPLAMVLGLAAGLAGMAVPALAGWLALPAKFLLTYMLDIASLLSRVPHAFVDDIGFSLPAMIGAYAGLALLTLILWHKTRKIV